MSRLSALLSRLAGRGSLDAVSSAQTTPTQGLIRIDYAASAPRPTEALLEVSMGAAEPILRRSVQLGGAPHRGWFALHGHLLPDGPSEVRLRLTTGTRTLASTRLTVNVRNVGELAAQVAASLRAHGAPLAAEGACDSTAYDYADPALVAWFDRAPEAVEAHLAGLAAGGEADAAEIAALRRFALQGYLELPGVVDADHLARLNAALEDAVARRVDGYEWGSSQRIRNLHLDYPAVRELWLHPRILRMLKLIFGEPAKPCQTLAFVFGSQQDPHQDTIHLTPFPAGRMCGVWTALEDVQTGSGELVVYPGSHRLDRVYMSPAGAAKVTDEDWTQFGETVVSRWTGMIAANGLVPEVYRPKAGSVLIWHENLMHGGSARLDASRSRRSIVGHYFANGAVAYYDSSGVPAALLEEA